MIHQMTLHPVPYDAIRRGIKTVEMRLYDDKRRAISAGDIICFTCTGVMGEMLTAHVDNLRVFPDFASLYAAYDKRALGYGASEMAHFSDMEKYYNLVNIERFGVVAIEITLIA